MVDGREGPLAKAKMNLSDPTCPIRPSPAAGGPGQTEAEGWGDGLDESAKEGRKRRDHGSRRLAFGIDYTSTMRGNSPAKNASSQRPDRASLQRD